MLGGILLRNDVLKKLDRLEVEDFHSPRHQSVFAAMRNLEMAGTPIDQVTLRGELERVGRWESLGGEAGGVALLVGLAMNVPTPDNVVHYAAIVTRHRVVRDLLCAIADVQEALNDRQREGDLEGEAAVQYAQARLGQVKAREDSDGTITIARLTHDRLAQLEQIAADRASGVQTLTGITTGIRALDEKIGGYQPGIVTIVAARPGMGKSSLLREAANAASKAGIGAHTFSVEDMREKFADRTISSESGVAAENIRTCNLNVGQTEDLRGAVGRLFRRKGWLVDDRSLTATDVVRSWRRHGEKNGTKVVCVDYLQRLRKSDSRMSDFEHVSESMDQLANAAKDDRIVCLVGSQLNRECEKRDNKRPQKSDMRGGGPIEEIAKCIIGMYRGSQYGPPVEGEDYAPGYRPTAEEWAATVELILLKNSDGEEGRILATWHGPTTTVS